MKEQPRSVYRSMQGKEIDMNRLLNQNEMTVAVGNARVNARGDELGPGGRLIRKKDVTAKSSVPDQSNVRSVDKKITGSVEKKVVAQSTVSRKKPTIQPNTATPAGTTE